MKIYRVPDTPGSLFNVKGRYLHTCYSGMLKRENHRAELRCAKPLIYRQEKKTVQPLALVPTVGRLKKKLS
jgi:hypothetical protein